ncbi:MAG: hypothetical protein HC876_07205 [Chloroflexaceae bacterium]|nr:hypothetical protein [Chloroflexaceae bacterium]NJO05314.1 hypothetical protein [Chloroflexaceae bacterium]
MSQPQDNQPHQHTSHTIVRVVGCLIALSFVVLALVLSVALFTALLR